METNSVTKPPKPKHNPSSPNFHKLTFGPKGQPLLDGQPVKGCTNYNVTMMNNDVPRLMLELIVELS